MKEKFWNVPNALSLFRLLLVPVFLFCFFFAGKEDLYIAALVVFLVASVTDALDGFIARRNGQITKYGIVLDPLADKLLKASALISFSIVGIIPIWLTVILIFIDLAMIITGICLFNKQITVPSNLLGKSGTLIMTLGLVFCFFHKTFQPWDIIIIYIGLAIIVASVIVYIIQNYKKVFPKKNNENIDNAASK